MYKCSNVLDWLYYFICDKHSSIVHEHLVLGDNEILNELRKILWVVLGKNFKAIQSVIYPVGMSKIFNISQKYYHPYIT